MKFAWICGLLLVGVHAEIKSIYDFPEWWVNRDFSPDPGNQKFRDMRIIGGQEAEVNQFPYQAGLILYLKNSTDVGLCGGALLTADRVLTAAHCVDVVVGIDAVFGAHSLIRLEDDQVRRKVPTSDMVWHEGYDPKILTNDIAIIKISTPIPFSKAIQVVALPQTADLESDFVGEVAAVSGWGLFSSIQSISKYLRFIDVTVITNSECRIRFPTRIQNSTSKLLLLQF